MRARLVIVVAAAVLLGGCTSSTGGDATPTPTSAPPSPTPPSTTATTTPPSPRPTPSEPKTTGPNVRPGEKPPVFPTAAKFKTPQGAIAFARYFIAAFDWGYATNDPYLVGQISAPACNSCQSYIRGLRELISSGGHVKGGRVTIQALRKYAVPVNVKADYAFDISVREGVLVTVKPTSTATPQPAVANDHLIVFAAWTGGRWQVANIGNPQ